MLRFANAGYIFMIVPLERRERRGKVRGDW